MVKTKDNIDFVPGMTLFYVENDVDGIILSEHQTDKVSVVKEYGNGKHWVEGAPMIEACYADVTNALAKCRLATEQEIAYLNANLQSMLSRYRKEGEPLEI